MIIISASTQKPKKQWAVRFHRVTVDFQSYKSYLNAAAAGQNTDAARYAAVTDAIGQLLEDVSQLAFLRINTTTGFVRGATTPVGGVSVEIDHPSAALPCLMSNSEATDTDVGALHIGSNKRSLLRVARSADGIAWMTPFTQALTQLIAMRYYEWRRQGRDLSASEQQSYESIVGIYDQIKAAATSFYAWHVNDFVIVRGSYLWTPPGAVLDSSIDAGLTNDAVKHASPSQALRDAIGALRTTATSNANSIASLFDASIAIDDPATIVDYSTGEWARYDISEPAIIQLSATESRELFQTPQSLIGIAHELVKSAYGAASISLRDYANAIYYLGRGVARLLGKTDKEAPSVEFFLGAAYSSFDEYAAAVNLLPNVVSNPALLRLAHAYATRNWEVSAQTQADARVVAALSNYFSGRLVTIAGLQLVVNEFASSEGSFACSPSLADGALQLAVKKGAVDLVVAKLPLGSSLPGLDLADPAIYSAACQYVVARSARMELLATAAANSGTGWLVEMNPTAQTIAVTAPTVKLIRDRLAGVGSAADEFATPFKL